MTSPLGASQAIFLTFFPPLTLGLPVGRIGTLLR
jgi:hypothetical protein